MLSFDGGPYCVETSPLICIANQWTCFYMIGTTVMKELKVIQRIKCMKCFIMSTVKVNF